MHAHVSKLSVPYYGISKGFFKVHTHACTHVIPSQMYYGTSKNSTKLCKVHMHVYMSKLSIPSQMYYGTSKNHTDSIRLTCMHACPSCPSHPKCTMVPQRIPQNSVRYTCMYILCRAKLSVPSQMYHGFCKVHTHIHMSTLSIPSQMYFGTSKNPTEFYKVHMHVHNIMSGHAVRPISNV